MPAMMLPFAERSASGHPPGGRGVFGALIIEGALTWGPDVSERIEGTGGVGGVLIVEEKPGSTTGVAVGAYYPLCEGNGNIAQLLDAPGGVAAHYDYDAFGNVTVATGPAAVCNPGRFSTKPQDPVSGFHYYGYRHYDPVTGRWPSRDPIGEWGGGNLNRIISNNPLNRADILGLDDVRVTQCGRFHFAEYVEEGFLNSDGKSRLLGVYDPSSKNVTLLPWLQRALGFTELPLTTLEEDDGEDTDAEYIQKLRENTSFGLCNVPCPCDEIYKLIEGLREARLELSKIENGDTIRSLLENGTIVAGLLGEGSTEAGKKLLTTSQVKLVNTIEKSRRFNKQEGAREHPLFVPQDSSHYKWAQAQMKVSISATASGDERLARPWLLDEAISVPAAPPPLHAAPASAPAASRQGLPRSLPDR
jgi:RHS repeat-associated protein